VPLKAQIDEAADELAVWDARVFAQLGVHADIGEAGQGVDLIEYHIPCLCVKEVQPRKAAEPQFPECFNRIALQAFERLFGDGGGDDDDGIVSR